MKWPTRGMAGQTIAGPVTIRGADGTSEIREPYNRNEAVAVKHARADRAERARRIGLPIELADPDGKMRYLSWRDRARVAQAWRRRDHRCCYCGENGGPWTFHQYREPRNRPTSENVVIAHPRCARNKHPGATDRRRGRALNGLEKPSGATPGRPSSTPVSERSPEAPGEQNS